MTFTVTYRGADGAPKAETVEAASRTECLAQMKARGVVVLGVKEGGGRDKARPSRHSAPERDGRDKKGKGRKAVAYVLFVALVALAISGAWWWLGRDKAQPAPEPAIPKKSSALPKKVKPAAAPKPNETITNAAPVSTKKSPSRVAWRDSKLPEERRLEAYEKALAESPLPNTSSNRLFRSGIEQVMGWIFTTEVGEMPPPLPRISDFDIVHLQEIFDSKNEVGKTDTQKQADVKNTVDFAKAELKKYLEKGGDPDEFLKYYHDQLKTAHQHRQIVQDQVMKVLQEEPERAEDFLRDANKGLAELGIKAVVIPERIKQRFGLIGQKE